MNKPRVSHLNFSCFHHAGYRAKSDAGWSSLVARRAHNPKVVGSNPAPDEPMLNCDTSSVGRAQPCQG